MNESITEQEKNQVKNSRSLEVVLTQGALDNGYISLQSNQQLFPSEFIANDDGQAEHLFSLVLPNGKVKQTCVLGKYNRNFSLPTGSRSPNQIRQRWNIAFATQPILKIMPKRNLVL